MSSVVFIPSLLSDDVSQVGLLQLEELTRLQWSSNESLARNLRKSGKCYNYKSRCHYIHVHLQETYMFMYMYMYMWLELSQAEAYIHVYMYMYM